MKDSYIVSSDKKQLNIDVIHHFLCFHSYWAKGITKEIVQKSIDHSALCFGVYKVSDDQLEQIGFARVISDLSTFAYLADVFILPDYRGIGLSKKLIKNIIEHPELNHIRRAMLATKDAHQLYEKFGFKQISDTNLFMELKKN
ncbi:GNAT family N-acetyltransferase [Bacillus aquiflavi]|uniref:GNAT family N-acetyltransferase n=1 Tax=Bacillus aquiflavi TaxID=2672567 RepID=A0A6B3VW79_9BACI|nr:GNAT family N-acetyltransferase [Bacillus aquiflavi]MBA4536174.1 GNAT family N-acetyltransferase [Bacillus aquiflavi]NEY80547.1 GNAT family N-acetyltransferase [Bacillus aquiflavi]UAC46989.1 GNAT family N-acetyltransferase [Bacillus aquiflavi]